MAPRPAQHTADSADGLALIRDLLTSLPAAVAYVTGPDFVFEFANDIYRQTVGGRELVGRRYREALPELAGQGRFETLDKVYRTGEPFLGRETEVWVRQDGGQPRQIFVDITYQAVRDSVGDVVGVLLYGSDVTAHVHDRRRLEELAGNLASSEERYRGLFETLPAGVIHYHADGSVIGANPAASEMLGLPREKMTDWLLERTRRAVHEDGTPFTPDELPVTQALRTGTVVPNVVVGVPHGRTGKMRWLRITAIPDALDCRGRPQRAYAMLTDITQQRRAQATARQSSELLGRLRDANVLGMASATEKGIYEANDAFLDMIGYSREDVAAGRVSHQTITSLEWAGHDRAALDQLRTTGAFQAYDKEYIHRDGHRVPVMVGAVATDHNPLRWVTFIVDLTAPQRTERERAALLAQTQSAIAEADAARERLSFLLRAGDLVAATGNRQELLDQVARLVVPTLADCCVVFLPTVQGTLHAAALTHRDPACHAALESLRTMHIPLTGPLIVQAAFADAHTQFVPRVSREVLAGEAEEIIRIEKKALLNSALATPLLVGQRPLGVVLMGRGEARATFTQTDVPVVEELARRVAAGLANVETFAREHTVAETLQQALLPEAPPDIEGLDIAVSYLPAADGVHVGGDWYDAFPLHGDRVGLAIGDVAGHSIASASIMGQIRNLLRAYAMDDPSPPKVLRRTNAAMAQLLPDAIATVFYAVLDLSTGDLAYANAGHPPPLLANGHDHTEYLDGKPDVLLGAREDTTFTGGHHRLMTGGRLLLYTDGLVEDRRRDITEGLAALAAAMRRSPAGQTAEQTCVSVQSALIGTTPRADDVCVFAARLTR